MKLNRNKIEAIIFDLGGVLLNIDINNPFQKLKTLLGVGLEEEGLHIIKNHGIFLQFEIGKLSPTEFRNEVRKISTNDFTDEAFDEIWNSIILDYPAENIRFLEKIKSNYRTFLMSNTNKIHCDYYSKTLFETFGYSQLDELFEKSYYSHTSGMRKPNRDFFEHILNGNGLKASSTLFVDDFIENIETAKDLGINTFQITNGAKVVDILS